MLQTQDLRASQEKELDEVSSTRLSTLYMLYYH